MGYTHYWRDQRSFTEAEWKDIVLATNNICDRAKAAKIILCDGLGRKGTSPIINNKEISLNGKENLSHETFCLTKNKCDFNFCKTAQKPYDAVVVSILFAVSKIAPDALRISSDGGDQAIQPILNHE